MFKNTVIKIKTSFSTFVFIAIFAIFVFEFWNEPNWGKAETGKCWLSRYFSHDFQMKFLQVAHVYISKLPEKLKYGLRFRISWQTKNILSKKRNTWKNRHLCQRITISCLPVLRLKLVPLKSPWKILLEKYG